MLDVSDIDRVAHDAAASALKGIELVGVHGEPTLGSDGDDAVLVAIVIRPGKIAMSGNAALHAIVSIRQGLVDAGEERFPIVDFATEEAMMQVDDGS